jgi:hypothetical protein
VQVEETKRKEGCLSIWDNLCGNVNVRC